MIFSPINKLILCAVLLAGLLFGLFMLDKSRQKVGYDRAVAEYQTKLIAAQADAKAQEVAWQSRQKNIQEKTNDEINKRDAQYAVLSRTADGLRDTIATLGNGLSTDSIGACRERASTLADVLGQCSERLRDMAKAADGQYIDAVSCREAWPQ